MRRGVAVVMIRKLGGIAAGIAIALVIMVAVEAVGYRLFGVPAIGDDVPATVDAALPFGVQLSVLTGWFLGTLIGGYAAVAVSRLGWTAWAVSAAILVAVVIRFALAAAPTWMIAAGLALPLVASAIAQRLPRKPSVRSANS